MKRPPDGPQERPTLAGLERAVQQQPMSAEAWTRLGEAYSKSGQHEIAVCALGRATELEPSSPGSWLRLSVALGELDREPPALEAAQKAVSLDPGSYGALVNLGRRLLFSGRHREAVRELERARRIREELALVSLLGMAYYCARDYHAAAEYLERLLRVQPDRPATWGFLGVALESTGRHEEAVRALETAVSADADNAKAWAFLARALQALGRHEEALRACEKSIEHGFELPSQWKTLGEIAVELRDVPLLRRACRELARLDAGMAKPLRLRLRSLRRRARPGAPATRAANDESEGRRTSRGAVSMAIESRTKLVI